MGDEAKLLVRLVKTEGCWTWIGYRNPSGYGMLGRRWAHRVAYETWNGPIPAGTEIHHTCQNRLCVNPTHLVTLTSREHKAEHAPATCIHGHPFDEANTYIRKDRRGSRICRRCRAAGLRRYRAKARNAQEGEA